MFTLNTIERHAVCYGISSFDSNSMKSSNPHSGIYEAQTSRTLDLNGGNPSCNQGGVLVVMERTHEQNELLDTVGCTESEEIVRRGGWQPTCVMATSCWNAPFTDGTISPALCARAGTGGNQLPLIVLMRIEDESISNKNRGIMCEQPSGELHRTGCIQRYAAGVQEE